MTTTTTTTTDLLPLLWLASPALPVGAFSYSEGLESAVDSGRVTNDVDAAEWLAQQLHLVIARSEMPVVARAMRAWREHDHDAVRALDEWVLQTRETSEFRRQAEQMGRSLVEWLRGTRPDAIPAAPPRTWSVAWALAATAFGAGIPAALHAYAFGWAENMMQAAVKSVPLGQAAGQRILARLVAEIPEAVASAQDAEPQAFSPMLAILSSNHETQYSRLFRS